MLTQVQKGHRMTISQELFNRCEAEEKAPFFLLAMNFEDTITMGILETVNKIAAFTFSIIKESDCIVFDMQNISSWVLKTEPWQLLTLNIMLKC